MNYKEECYDNVYLFRMAASDLTQHRYYSIWFDPRDLRRGEFIQDHSFFLPDFDEDNPESVASWLECFIENTEESDASILSSFPGSRIRILEERLWILDNNRTNDGLKFGYLIKFGITLN